MKIKKYTKIDMWRKNGWYAENKHRQMNEKRQEQRYNNKKFRRKQKEICRKSESDKLTLF